MPVTRSQRLKSIDLITPENKVLTQKKKLKDLTTQASKEKPTRSSESSYKNDTKKLIDSTKQALKEKPTRSSKSKSEDDTKKKLREKNRSFSGFEKKANLFPSPEPDETGSTSSQNENSPVDSPNRVKDTGNPFDNIKNLTLFGPETKIKRKWSDDSIPSIRKFIRREKNATRE